MRISDWSSDVCSSDLVERIRDRMQNTSFDLFQDMGRLRGIIYACYYGHWQPGGEDENAANPVHAQIGFTPPQFRHRGRSEERRVGKEGVSTGRSRWPTYH